MTLSVVGTGFGRTGTKSLKLALERLGYGPCHHMLELRSNSALLPYWVAASRGELPDWEILFNDYKATVDWPSTRFWREITDFYSAARVIHTVRPVDNWLDSIQRTIFPVIQNWMDQKTKNDCQRSQMAWALIGEQTFQGRIDDKPYLRAVFEAHTSEVMRSISSDRLLIFDVIEGWNPLCKFLEVEVPEEPFPHTNTTADFNARRARNRQSSD